MVFAAAAHAILGLPEGDMGDDLPERDNRALSDIESAIYNLSMLADALDMPPEKVPTHLHEFRLASAGTTQRIKSRRIRFPATYQALLPNPI